MRIRLAHIGVNHPHALGYRETLALMPEVELVAFYDEEPDRARSLLRGNPAELAAFHEKDPRLGRGRVARDYAEIPIYCALGDLLRETSPEAVLINLPNDVTPGAIIQCAEAGCHIFAEKPCARTVAEFAPAAQAVKNAGRRFSTGYIRRASAIGQAIKAMVDDGLLGRLVSVEARWITTSVAVRDPQHLIFSRERSGGGILHWLGCHWLDFMRWVSSAEVTEVAAIMDTLSGEAIGVEDTASLSLRYDNGMIGSLHCAYTTDKARDQLFFGLRGTLGWIEWERNRNLFTIRSTHPAWATAPTRVMRFEQDETPGYCGADGLAALKEFVASFREGARPLFTTDDALRVLQALDAAHESARTRRLVTLSGESPRHT